MMPFCPQISCRAGLKITAGLALSLIMTSCRLVHQTAELPARTVSAVTGTGQKEPAVDTVEMQQMLMRFADEFSTRMVLGVDKLRRGTNQFDVAQVLQWKIAFATETCSIVSGPNALANLLDLTAFVTLTRIAVEEHWQPNVFGESAQPLLESCRNSESNIWRLIEKVITPQQRAEFLVAMEKWRGENPLPEGVLATRALGFTSHLTSARKADSAKPGSVFNLLMLDPLAGLDPATREIAQTRLFAERALYVTEKFPMLLRWQTELLSVNASRLPAVQQLVTNSTQLAAVAERYAAVAEQLPQLVNDQRVAAIQQIFDGIAAERTNLFINLAADELKLRETLAGLHQTLGAGTELMKSTEATAKTLDAFLGRWDTNSPAAVVTNGRPFDILDYAVTAKEVTGTMKELNLTLQSLDKTLPQIQKAGDTLESAGARLINRLFLVGAALIILFLGGGFCVATVYRRFAIRSAPAVSSERSGRVEMIGK